MQCKRHTRRLVTTSHAAEQRWRCRGGRVRAEAIAGAATGTHKRQSYVQNSTAISAPPNSTTRGGGGRTVRTQRRRHRRWARARTHDRHWHWYWALAMALARKCATASAVAPAAPESAATRATPNRAVCSAPHRWCGTRARWAGDARRHALRAAGAAHRMRRRRNAVPMPCAALCCAVRRTQRRWLWQRLMRRDNIWRKQRGGRAGRSGRQPRAAEGVTTAADADAGRCRAVVGVRNGTGRNGTE